MFDFRYLMLDEYSCISVIDLKYFGFTSSLIRRLYLFLEPYFDFLFVIS